MTFFCSIEIGPDKLFVDLIKVFTPFNFYPYQFSIVIGILQFWGQALRNMFAGQNPVVSYVSYIIDKPYVEVQIPSQVNVRADWVFTKIGFFNQSTSQLPSFSQESFKEAGYSNIISIFNFPEKQSCSRYT